ncbi:hypothetical protein CRYUN_Cryun38cG0020200 [Craigia yunnanensis]
MDSSSALCPFCFVELESVNHLFFSYLGQLIDIAKLRSVEWFKAKWPSNADLVQDFFRFPSDVAAPSKGLGMMIARKWSKPFPDSLKFNVDGSALGKPGAAGIGGVLRDVNEDVKFPSLNPLVSLIQTWLIGCQRGFLHFCGFQVGIFLLASDRV